MKTHRQRAIVANAAERDRANTDPKARWTGYIELVARMQTAEPMVAGVGIDPCCPEQYAAYRWLQNEAVALGYERRPPAKHGDGCVYFHFERRTT